MGLGHLYFNPSGRINRSTYWLKGILLLNVIWVAIWIALFGVAILQARDSVNLPYRMEFIGSMPYLIEHMAFNLDEYMWLIIPAVALWFVYLWNGFAVTVKRMHDRDNSAWWLVFCWVVTIVGALVFQDNIYTLILSIFVAGWMFVQLGCLDGTPSRNRYGYPEGRPTGHQPGQQTRTQTARGQPAPAGARPVQQNPHRQPAPAGARPVQQAAYGQRQPVAPQTSRRVKVCPYCAEDILVSAVVCRYCLSDLYEETTVIEAAVEDDMHSLPAPGSPQPCPNPKCGNRFVTDKCSHCGTSIDAQAE